MHFVLQLYLLDSIAFLTNLIAVRNFDRKLTLCSLRLTACLARFLACALLAIKVPSSFQWKKGLDNTYFCLALQPNLKAINFMMIKILNKRISKVCSNH
jgi:hypothetical protein